MPTFDFKPGDFDGKDISGDGYHYDSDSDFSDTVENINTFTAPNQEPGEIWEITARLTLSSDSGSGPTYLEFRSTDGNDILARNGFEEFEGGTVELSLLVPTWLANEDFGPPASSSADIEVLVNNVSGSTYNYFVDLVAVRIRGPIDQGSNYQAGAAESFDSGLLS